MSDLLAESAERLFGEHCTDAVLAQSDGAASDGGSFPLGLWEAVSAAGFTAALLPEAAGGFGASVAEGLGLLRVSARHAAPIPLAETMLGGWLLAGAGLAVPEGVLSVAPVRKGDRLGAVRERTGRGGAGWRVTGRAERVPWGRDAAFVVVLAKGPEGWLVGAVPASGFAVMGRDLNLAGEPRDTVAIDAVIGMGRSLVDGPGLRAAGAAVRTVQIAGALSRALEISVAYAQTRVQFGRAIGTFQAIQHNLAVLAGQSAAAIAAADMAVEAVGSGLGVLALGAAKARAGEAAGVAAGLAHQAHGAIGFTREYRLHRVTRRLWAWREEFGNEAEWNAVVGGIVLAAGADGVWPALTPP